MSSKSCTNNTETENYCKLDDILAKFKLFGPYYLKCLCMVSFVFLANCINASNYVFVAKETAYRCKDPRFNNNTCGSIENASDVCIEWLYDDPDSFVAEFHLACQEWKRTLVGTIHSFGYMIGLLFVGPLSDRIGRMKTIALTGTLGGAFGTLKSFSNSYWLFIVLEFLESSLGDIGSPIYMYSVEMIDHNRRLIYTCLCGVGFPLGFAALALLAWLVPYWRQLVVVLYAPNLLFILYFWILDESPRWLLSTGEKTKTSALLIKAAQKDKVKLDKKELNNLSYEDNKGISFMKLLKNTMTSKSLLKRLLICITWWITSTFVNYGLQINAVSLAGNKYVNFSLLTVTELIGNLFSTYLLYRFRRKLPLAFTFFMASLLCLVQPFVPTNIPWLSVLIYMTGKLMSAMYFYITYLYTSEIFPTYTRNSMHALCSSMGRIGSIIAPQTPLLMVYWHGLPSVIFGFASLCAGFTTLLAPDTADEALPDTITQAEAIGYKQHNIQQIKITQLELELQTKTT